MRHTWEDPHKSNGCETKVHGQSVVMRSDDDISGGPWSSCSKTDFEAHYLQNKDNWCMEGIVCTNCLFMLRIIFRNRTNELAPIPNSILVI